MNEGTHVCHAPCPDKGVVDELAWSGLVMKESMSASISKSFLQSLKDARAFDSP